MGLLEFPLKRYQFTIITFILLCALGWSSFKNIPRQEDPYFPIAGFTIAAIMPGAEPQDIERLIAKPIEDRITELDDVKKIESAIADGAAQIVVQYFPNVDVEKKYDELVRELNALRPELPSELQKLEIGKINPGLVNIVQYALVSDDAPYPELEESARQLRDLFRGVSGVRTAQSWAFPARELRVALDLSRMTELNLTQAQVIQALQSENASIPGGVIDVGSRSFSLKTSGSYQSLDEVRDTVVASVGGRSVRVRDLADVNWDTRQQTYVGRYNGQRAVFVTANQKDGFNIFDTRAGLVATAEKFAKTLPKRIKLERGFDQSENVSRRLSSLGMDFGLAIGLVLLTLLPLGLRSAGVVMISIPLSLAIGVSVLYFLDFSLNQISIAGFVIALGLLVDDSIVVVENITRFLREGHSRKDAALLATKQIALAVLGCTATLMFAFLPLMMLVGDSGKFIRVLPTAVLATIGASLLVSLTIIPFLASRFLKDAPDAHGNRVLQWVMSGIHRFYKPLLHRALERPKRTVTLSLVACLSVIVVVGAVIGFSLFPKADTPHFMIYVKTPEGSSLAETDRALRYAEQQVQAMPGVESFFSNLGHGNPKIYYNIIPREDATNYAELFVKVKVDTYRAKTMPGRLDELRVKMDAYPNARIEVREFESGPPISAPVAIRVIGPELDALHILAAEVERVMSEVPGAIDVVNPVKVQRTNLRLHVDTQKAAMLGIASVEIDRAVRLSVAGLPVGKFKESNGEQYDIVVRTPISARADLNALNEVRVASAHGQVLPLSQLARLEFASAPTQIHRYNRDRAVVIDAQVKSGYNTAKVTDAVLERLDQMQWPRGYSYVPGGELESRNESFGGLGAAMIVAVLGIVAILVLEFGSFKSTLIVLTVVPFGIAGGIVMLALTGNSISFTAAVGFIALIGMEIKNSILLVDFTNQLRERGMDLDAAIEKAGEIRFLPILLTSATATGGLLPLALQGNGMYSPLAWVMIGGLIASTLVARVVTPVVYKLIPPSIERAVSEEQIYPAGAAIVDG
ncbi:MAG: efflux RND transporter permease subunit [Candidatus Obscuribacterales bacterium]|nr:efflux RND transporter permease subunit [Steroidobacteraceae bacterium]